MLPGKNRSNYCVANEFNLSVDEFCRNSRTVAAKELAIMLLMFLKEDEVFDTLLNAKIENEFLMFSLPRRVRAACFLSRVYRVKLERGQPSIWYGTIVNNLFLLKLKINLDSEFDKFEKRIRRLLLKSEKKATEIKVARDNSSKIKVKIAICGGKDIAISGYNANEVMELIARELKK